MSDTTSLFEGSSEEVDDTSFYTSEEVPPEQPYIEEERKPERYAARTSGENLLATAWFAIGGILVSKRIDPPVGRCLQLEAPLAAQEIDKVIAGTFLDRILQPIFRKGDQLEGLGAIIALPVMVGLYERKPNLAPLLEEQMKQTLGNVLLDVVPLMNKNKAKMRRSARSLKDVNEAFDIPRGADPINYIYDNWVFQDNKAEEGVEENGAQPKFS
jgi:hypothetical protein